MITVFFFFNVFYHIFNLLFCIGRIRLSAPFVLETRHEEIDLLPRLCERIVLCGRKTDNAHNKEMRMWQILRH